MAYVFLYGVSVSKTSLYKACRNKILGPSGRTRPVCRTDLAQLLTRPVVELALPKSVGLPSVICSLYLRCRSVSSAPLHCIVFNTRPCPVI